MKFLLLGIPLAMILIIIIASCIPSLSDKQKEIFQKTPNKPRAKKRSGPVPVLIFLALVVVAGVILMRNYHHSVYQVASDAQDTYVNSGKTIKVKIQSDQWSGWIIGPRYGRFTIDTPSADWFEIFLCTGKQIRVPANKWRPLGAIPGNRFRIRGSGGEATIAVFEE